MADRDQVLAEIRRLAREELKLEREPQPGDRLIADLELDSMTLTTLAVALEDRFRIALTGAPEGRLDTVGDLASYVAELSEATEISPPAGLSGESPR